MVVMILIIVPIPPFPTNQRQGIGSPGFGDRHFGFIRLELTLSISGSQKCQHEWCASYYQIGAWRP